MSETIPRPDFKTTLNDRLGENGGVLEQPTSEWDIAEITPELVEQQYDTVDTPIDSLELVTDQPSTDRAASRLGNLLRSSADRADSLSESAAEYKDKARTKLRHIGAAALRGAKEAGLITVGLGVLGAEATGRGAKRATAATGDAMMAGFAKAESGMDYVGAKMLDTQAKVKDSYTTYQFNRELRADEKQFQKQNAKELKAFEKSSAKEAKIQAKQDKRNIKEAAREDRRFERSMRKKAALERRDARRAKWSSTYNTLRSTAQSGVESTKNFVSDTAEKSRDAAERAKRKAKVTRTAGRMALATYRDTKEAFRNQ